MYLLYLDLLLSYLNYVAAVFESNIMLPYLDSPNFLIVDKRSRLSVINKRNHVKLLWVNTVT